MLRAVTVRLSAECERRSLGDLRTLSDIRSAYSDVRTPSFIIAVAVHDPASRGLLDFAVIISGDRPQDQSLNLAACGRSLRCRYCDGIQGTMQHALSPCKDKN